MEHRSSDAQREAVQSAVQEMWSRMRETAHSRLAAVERAVQALQAGELSEALRQEAEREAHKMAGSLGVFGVPEGSRLAREIEDLLASGESGEGRVLRLGELVRDLRSEVERAG